MPNMIILIAWHCITVQMVSYGRQIHHHHNACGSGGWQQHHSKLQEIMEQSPLSHQRIAVHNANQAGIGDRLTGTVTMFMYALLTGRMFRIKWAHSKLEYALEPHWIDWRFQEEDQDVQHGQVFKTNLKIRGNPSPLINHLFREQNLSDFSKARTVMVVLNQGQLWNLFDNPLYKGVLKKWGFGRENTFGCVIDYLFRIRPVTLEALSEQWRQVAKSGKYRSIPFPPPAEGLLIGIQIRLGDKVMRNSTRCEHAFTTAHTRKFFDCAGNILKELNREARFILLSDCQPLRQAAAAHFGSSVITEIDKPITHLLNQKGDILQFRKSISELYLFSIADVHIVTKMSSFGKVGAFISLKKNTIYSIDSITPSWCSKKTFDSWQQYSRVWVRV